MEPLDGQRDRLRFAGQIVQQRVSVRITSSHATTWPLHGHGVHAGTLDGGHVRLPAYRAMFASLARGNPLG